MAACISQTLPEKIGVAPGPPVNATFPESWQNPGIAYGIYPLAGGHFECPTCGGPCHYFDRAVAWAIHEGYRHIDTAQHYGNEGQASYGIQGSAVARDEIFLTTKLTEDTNGRGTTRAALDLSIDRLAGLTPDLALIHYPRNDIAGAWHDLLDARAAGLCRHVGVSNFEIRHLERVHQSSGIWPEVNQIEFHPLMAAVQLPTVQFCLERSIAVEGFSPLAQGQLLANPAVLTLALAYGWTPAQLLLRWCIQHRVKPIVSSRSVGHLREDIASHFITDRISVPDMDAIDQLGPTYRVSLNWYWDSSQEP